MREANLIKQIKKIQHQIDIVNITLWDEFKEQKDILDNALKFSIEAQKQLDTVKRIVSKQYNLFDEVLPF